MLGEHLISATNPTLASAGEGSKIKIRIENESFAGSAFMRCPFFFLVAYNELLCYTVAVPPLMATPLASAGGVFFASYIVHKKSTESLVMFVSQKDLIVSKKGLTVRLK